MQEPSYSEIEFTNPYKDRPYVISNMIISADGNTLFTNEDSTGLGSAVDRRLMGELRFHADAVINGAETFFSNMTRSRPIFYSFFRRLLLTVAQQTFAFRPGKSFFIYFDTRITFHKI